MALKIKTKDKELASGQTGLYLGLRLANKGPGLNVYLGHWSKPTDPSPNPRPLALMLI